jgi:hypothetical protein
MASAQISMVRFAMKFGAIGGAISIALSLLFFALAMSESPLLQYANYLLILAIIVWGQFEYRRAETLTISYGETFGLSMLIMCYFTVLVTAYGIIHWSLIDPETANRVMAAAEAAVRGQNLPEQQFEVAMQMQKLLIGPIVTPLFGALGTMLIGVLISLITSIFMRRGLAIAST